MQLDTSASCTSALPKGPSMASAAASSTGTAGSAVTTDAGVKVVAALADTTAGTLAVRRLPEGTLCRALKGLTTEGPALIKDLDVCMWALIAADVAFCKLLTVIRPLCRFGRHAGQAVTAGRQTKHEKALLLREAWKQG